jgi:transcriptional regulator with XRE-family HTH domain
MAADIMLAMPSISYREARQKIALQIKEARLQSGLSQYDVARVLNISQSSYSRIERGVLGPDCAQIRVLSGLHGLSVLWLLGVPSYIIKATNN